MRSVKALFVMALVILLLVGTGIILKLRAGADATGTDRSASAPTPAAARGSPASTSPAETAVEAEASIGPSGVATNYELKNAADAGAEWSSNKTHVPPKTNRTYLGDYGPGQPLTLTLNRLPRHELIRITFDLYLTRSWDGSSPIWGNCLWLAELNGRKLIASTFGNCGFFSDNDEQSFPDPYPCRPHPAWTGATEHETLGVM